MLLVKAVKAVVVVEMVAIAHLVTAEDDVSTIVAADADVISAAAAVVVAADVVAVIKCGCGSYMMLPERRRSPVSLLKATKSELGEWRAIERGEGGNVAYLQTPNRLLLLLRIELLPSQHRKRCDKLKGANSHTWTCKQWICAGPSEIAIAIVPD